MNISLHIERLVLDGIDFAPRQRQQLRAAIESELARLLGTETFLSDLPRGGAVASISTPVIELQSNPTDLGKQIAGSVFGGIGG